MKIKKGDKVVITTGSEKGKTGQILRVMPKLNQVIVNGINIKTNRVKPTKKGESGSSVTKERPIDMSNITMASATTPSKKQTPATNKVKV